VNLSNIVAFVSLFVFLLAPAWAIACLLLFQDCFFIFFKFDIVGGGVQLGPLGTAATNRHIVPALGDYDDAEIGMIDRGNCSTRRKPPPVPLYPPQAPHTARTRTRTTAVGSQRLTTWATAQPSRLLLAYHIMPIFLSCVNFYFCWVFFPVLDHFTVSHWSK
jgi:hypothetical protein